MLKLAWFQIHWLIGITAGIVLAVVGLTGAMLSFEHEMKIWINPGVMTVATGTAPLPADALLARIEPLHPGRRVTSLALSSDPSDAVRVVLAPRPGDKDKRRGET